MGATSGPEVKLFKRFKDQWEFIDKASFQTATSDTTVVNAMNDVKDDLLHFAQSQLCEEQPRDDYREFLELGVVFLGGVPLRGISFMAPGAMHHARWMSKVLYSLKVWMFRGQFHITAREEKGLRDFVVFAGRVYLKAWITAPSAIAAPLNDLQLMNSLLQYASIHRDISAATSKKLSHHLWYLSEELIGLALFDSRVFSNTKRQMLDRLSVKGPDRPVKRPDISLKSFTSLTLDTFVTSNSMNIFHCLQLPTDSSAQTPTHGKHMHNFWLQGTDCKV
jgi:hypothetical protein